MVAGGLRFGAPGFTIINQAVTWGGDSMSWYVAGAHSTSGSYDPNDSIYQLNHADWVYSYAAIG